MISRSTDIRSALRSRQRGFIMRPNRMGSTGDPYFAQVQALLHFDGVSGTSTFTDVKGHGFALSGAPVIQNGQFVFGNCAAAFSGTQSILSTSADFTIGANDYTVDFWLQPTRRSGADTVFDNRGPGIDGIAVYHSVGGDGRLQIYNNGALIGIAGAALPTNVWAFVRIVRTGGILYAAVDGTTVLSGADARTYGASPTIRFALDFGGTQFGQFYLDDFRLTIGTARNLSEVPVAAFPDS